MYLAAFTIGLTLAAVLGLTLVAATMIRARRARG